jgi:hypothetical protein
MERDTAEIMQGLLQKTLDEIAGMTNSGARKGLASQERAHKLARTWGFDHFIKPSLTSFAKWLENSNENTNYTYDLTMGNRHHLAGFVDAITGCSIEGALSYIDELLLDDPLRNHINELCARDPDGGMFVDRDMGFGRRIGWYAIVRAIKPKYVIETGVDKGVGSVVIAAALLQNNKEGCAGEYLGTDINPKAGFLFHGKYASCGRVVYGDSIETLKTIDRDIDLFINDSDHSAEYEAQEYEAIAAKLSSAALILGDNAHLTSALFEFAQATRRKFLFFAEKPADHFYPGAGIGAAFASPAPAQSAGCD